MKIVTTLLPLLVLPPLSHAAPHQQLELHPYVGLQIDIPSSKHTVSKPVGIQGGITALLKQHEADLHLNTTRLPADENEKTAFALQAQGEYGYRIYLDKGVSIVPKAGLFYRNKLFAHAGLGIKKEWGNKWAIQPEVHYIKGLDTLRFSLATTTTVFKGNSLEIIPFYERKYSSLKLSAYGNLWPHELGLKINYRF